MFAYTVSCRFTEETVAHEWVEWLRIEHLDEVLAAGALDAEVVRLDGDAIVLEVRYHFPDRAAFDRYVRDSAPALRARGLELFPPERGLAYARSSGDVLIPVRKGVPR